MEADLIEGRERGAVSPCPVTGLPAYTRPEWTDVRLGANYYMSVRVIGDHILVGKIVGESDLASVTAATEFMDRVIGEIFGTTRRFVYVEDFTELKNLTSDCKRYYMRYLESKKQMLALIICTASPLIMLAVRLNSRLKLVRCRVLAEKDIDAGIRRAARIVAHAAPESVDAPFSAPQLSTVASRCPVSGLSLTTNAEWCRMDLGGPSVTFTRIGRRILHTEFHDWEGADPLVCKRFHDKRERVMASMFSPADRFVELRNYGGMKKKVPVLVKDDFVCYSQQEDERAVRLIGYNLPWLTRVGFNLRKLGFLARCRWRMCRDYDEALKTAVYALKSQGFTPEGTRNTVRNSAWTRHFDDFEVAFEVMDGNVLHRISRGTLRAGYIDQMFSLQEIVLSETGLDQKIHYILSDLGELEGAGMRLRKTYFKTWASFLRSYPGCRMSVMYGGDRITRAGLSISSYLRPFRMHVVDTPEEAMQQIVTDKAMQRKGRRIPSGQSTDEKDRIRQYADELIYFLGNINWEVDGFVGPLAEKSPDHPFKVVYDAVSLIKMDIDELFRERERSQVALAESKEVATALINATNDSSVLIKTDGTILSANDTFARGLGQTPADLIHQDISLLADSSLIDKRMAPLKTVILSGQPVRFEDEDKGVCYDNTIYPVFNSEGQVDRVAMYSRDITDLKKAEKHIQTLTQEIIKAQENERQRIARDLHDNVAQDLASLIISSDTLFEGFDDIPKEVRRRTEQFSKVLKRAISSIRELAYDLRPPSLDQLGLVRTLSQYCTDYSETNLIAVDFYSAGLEKLALDFDTEINLYRLIQEALNNVRKHSGADHVTIRLVASYPEIILRIEDTGQGFDLERRAAEALNEKRMGLKSMEERVKLLKGSFTIRSRPGEGTMILVKLPYSQGQVSWDEEYEEREKALQ
ncbi:hypothetical protein JCM14469_22230 [Desulfatiferula olefinivorans]